MKQYFTGFFTAVCLTASVFIFMGSQNKNLGDIVVHSIKVVNEEGNKVISLNVAEHGGIIGVFNNYAKTVVAINAYNNKGVLSVYNDKLSARIFDGALLTYNEHDKMTGYFGTDFDNHGSIHLFDEFDKEKWSR